LKLDARLHDIERRDVDDLHFRRGSPVLLSSTLFSFYAACISASARHESGGGVPRRRRLAARRARKRAGKMRAGHRDGALVPALEHRLRKRLEVMSARSDTWAPGAREAKKEPLEYMQLCRTYLAKLDKMGWDRSYHQRLFHDDFLKACTRSFWKLEPPGQFARDHQRVLRVNSWDHIAQEILISTPRRLGKTISVSMFDACSRGYAPGMPGSRDQHLQHVQAHQPEDFAQRPKVRNDDRRFRLRVPELQREEREHGGDQPAGPARQHRHPNHQQLPEQGRVSSKVDA
jgi:hypothetical protein